jgi:hypothetical protein
MPYNNKPLKKQPFLYSLYGKISIATVLVLGGGIAYMAIIHNSEKNGGSDIVSIDGEPIRERSEISLKKP